MLENLINFFKKINRKDEELLPSSTSGDAAKERLHLVLMQDRANVSVDFLDLMKQEILDVIKKYIDIDESEMDVRFTNQINEDGTNGAPALYANIPIVAIKSEKKIEANQLKKEKENTTEISGEDKEKVTIEKVEDNPEDANKKEITATEEKIKEESKEKNKEKVSLKKSENKTSKPTKNGTEDGKSSKK